MKKTKRQIAIETADELGVTMYAGPLKEGKSNKEDDDLMSFHAWVCYNYPELEPLCFHCPTEFEPTNRTTSYAHHANKVKKGMKPRLCDWICLGSGTGPAFLMEAKRAVIGDSVKSQKDLDHITDQLKLLHEQAKHGHFVCVGLGYEGMKAAFLDYLSKL